MKTIISFSGVLFIFLVVFFSVFVITKNASAGPSEAPWCCTYTPPGCPIHYGCAHETRPICACDAWCVTNAPHCPILCASCGGG